jgi:uncharacterized protein YdiU (UPF0061 family)
MEQLALTEEQMNSDAFTVGVGQHSSGRINRPSVRAQRRTRYTNCLRDGGNYGIGRAISIGEFQGHELRWGAGRTPFHRGADGRAVLRSSIREFLAGMHTIWGLGPHDVVARY